jgi:hypothetical protein
MLKTFSTRSNGKRAIMSFRDKNPNFEDISLKIEPTGEDDKVAIEATLPAKPTDAMRAAVEAAGFKAIVPAAPAQSDAEAKKAEKAAAKAALMAQRAAATEEVKKVKAERKAARKAAPKAAKAAKETGERGAERPDGLREGTGAARMIDAVLRPTGATMPELLEVSGWAQCRPALFKAAERAGVIITVDKTVKPAVYRGRYDKRRRNEAA